MEAAGTRNSVPSSWAVTVLGIVWTGCAIAVSAAALASLPSVLPELPLAFWVMTTLALVCDAQPFTSPRRGQSALVLPSICFTFAILLAWGVGPAIAVQTVCVAVAARRMRLSRDQTVRLIAPYLLALAAAAAVIWFLGSPLLGSPTIRWDSLAWTDVAVMTMAAGVWILVRQVVIATLDVGLRFGGRPWVVVPFGVGFELFVTGGLLLLGPVLVTAAHASPTLLPLVLVPLYAAHQVARLSADQEQLARIDPLTGLANRKALLAEVADQVPAHAAAAATGTGPRYLALLVLDLDRFKHVNDALGHAVGDRLLIEVGKRLLATRRPGDVVARLGGDEFAILATRLATAEEAEAVAERVVAALAEPVTIDGLPLDVSASIGIALYPDHGDDFATLLRNADIAMYEAKRRGDAFARYAPEADHHSRERLRLLADLRRALDPSAPSRDVDGVGDITMYYQPQVSMETGEVVGVEALLRWHHPEHGLVDPEELIRIAEQSAVMRLLTFRVIDDVVEQLAKWAAAGIHLRAAVNVSVRDLHTGEIVDRVADRLARYAVPPHQLQLEITEGALMADPHRVLATIARLDRIGVKIALDDFGTGYSSMQHLRRLPLAEVKVDRSFVLGMTLDSDDAAIVRSIIDLSRALGLRVVAEGVEDERTWRLLHAAGCHVAQGWFYARPMPADELVAWLARYRPLRPGPPVPA